MMSQVSLKQLLDTHCKDGKLVWIGIRPGKNRPVTVVRQVYADCVTGLSGDHYTASGGRRQVTLFQWEHLAVLMAILGRPVALTLLRRNLAVKGINLLALKQRHIRIGSAVLKITGPCHPCSKMEKNLGPGGYQAMRGHGGVTAQVIESGAMGLGDRVTVLPGDETGVDVSSTELPDQN